jgi:tellurite resistance protein TehA-like permease
MSAEKKRIFTKVPAPICAVGLGLACLASATGGFAGFLAMPALLIWSYVIAVGAIIPLVLYLLKIILNFPAFKADMKHPVFGCILPAFGMATMILGHFLGLIDKTAGVVLWFVGVGIHFLFTATFLYYAIKEFKWEKVIAAYYVGPVGIVVGVVCGVSLVPVIGELFSVLNLFFFWWGTFWYIGLLPVLVARLLQRTIPEPKKPTNIIMNAPPNLLVAGIVTLFAAPPAGYGITGLDPMFALFMVVLSLITTVWIYALLIGKGYLWKKFNPGYAAFTFPTGIAAVGMLKYGVYLGLQGNPLHLLFKWIGIIEFIASSVIILYVAVCYLYFLAIKPLMNR